MRIFCLVAIVVALAQWEAWATPLPSYDGYSLQFGDFCAVEQDAEVTAQIAVEAANERLIKIVAIDTGVVYEIQSIDMQDGVPRSEEQIRRSNTYHAMMSKHGVERNGLAKAEKDTQRKIAALNRARLASGSCRVALDAEHSRRERLAETRPIEEIIAIPEQSRTFAEAQRVSRDKAEKERLRREAEERARREAVEAKAAADRAELEALKKNPEVMKLALSVKFCLAREARAEAIKEIANEKKYSKYGGVEHLDRLYNLQQEIRAADEEMKEWRTAARRAKVSIASCSTRDVVNTTGCIFDEHPPQMARRICENNRMAGRVRVFRDL